ncbi:glycosyltransferase [Novosphingobium pentaromativorans]|uniref:Glycosyl transferase, group 1 n=1 Tax=Novosphingobium pentaromativorans US6-1 TaxID=1088721 RepID=G6EDK9_9SPHN|nr:glycosyltransferase [Novosphingobium pentaromativorans]AIT79717.1 glycosyl transferase family 1 [Novosphingobium pentaromativorans US6-1]EHJ60637.1 glycosyl transferase, group 1 [Novosphingobium pentaromativorans US6-1]
MRIVDVCAFYSPNGGGVKTYIDQKLRIAPMLGHDVTILAPGDSDELVENAPGARIITLAAPRFPLDRKYWYFADERALHAALDRIGADVVEASSPWRSAAMVARWKGQARRSLVMHADPLSAYAYRWLGGMMTHRTIDRGFYRFWDYLRSLGAAFHTTICANNDLARRLHEGGVPGTHVQPLGIETQVFSAARRDPVVRARLLAACGLPDSAHLLVGAGRLAPEKRWPMVVDAVAAASRSVPVALALFGEGRERLAVLRAIGGNPHVRLFEPQRDRATFATILASADALVHGCEAETFCMVAAEARASGTPVIVPDSGGASDHARDGAGLTFKSASSIHLSSTISRFCSGAWTVGKMELPISHEDHFAQLFAHYESLRHVRHAA